MNNYIIKRHFIGPKPCDMNSWLIIVGPTSFKPELILGQGSHARISSALL